MVIIGFGGFHGFGGFGGFGGFDGFLGFVVSTEVCLVVYICRYPEIASSCILDDFPKSDSGVASYFLAASHCEVITKNVPNKSTP